MKYPLAHIKDVCSFRKGKKPRSFADPQTAGSRPYILIENFGGRRTSFTADTDCVLCDQEDTLLVCDGANTGLSSTGHNGYVGSTIAALKPDRSRIEPRYLYHFISSRFDVLNTRVRGAAIPHLERELMLNMPLVLPPLSEQHRIVRILDEAEGLRRLRAEADRRTADLIPAIFYDMFGDPAGKKKWPVNTIRDLADAAPGAIRTGPFGSQLRHSEFTDVGTPVLGIDNVVMNEFRWTSPRCVPPDKFASFRRFEVFPGDVVVTIMGTVGRCCVAPDDLPTCMSTKHLCVITPDRRHIHSRFLWGSLLFDEAVNRQVESVGRGAIMLGWNSGIISRLALRVPPMPLQLAFAARVAEVRAMEAEQAQSRRRLDDLLQSLLHEAFGCGVP
jgi:type I restriction enzyme S subunit